MRLNKFVLAAVFSVGAIALTPMVANAYIVCNHEGDCWHSHARVSAPGITFEYHPDSWYFNRHWDTDREHHWREYHEGRGYWRNGVWLTL